ncbi:arylsulfatase [Bacteroides sp. 51]|uniref:sulfatase family protein n=1 Tax=Bacteroides sp. 51 TaxID=2302938 RepID=UPI0013D8787F|nr:arylsulfatase [Bacteroides sp. 51]NDV82532.1 arylsulfatase [Bacteroides sp. 51]
MKNDLPIWSLLSGIALLSGCGSSSPKTDKDQQARKPNVIYIFSDDLGIGDLSCYGATQVRTPNIDRLAGQGAQFTNAYATSATSTPSRFGLLTGMYPWRQENTGIAPGNSELIIDTTCVTLADMFKDAGYSTGVVGKWHLGLGPRGGTDFNRKITPNAQNIGFDYEFVIPATVDRVPCVYVENGHVVNLDPNDPITVNYEQKVGNWPTGEENPELVKLKPSQGHNNTIVNGIPRIGWMTGGKSALWVDEDIADVITCKAKRYITDHKDQSFFLYMGTQDIHVPRIPHPRFAGKSGLGTRGDVILQLDWTIGEIMHTLDSLKLTDNTILIFTSDNGPVIDDGYQDEALEKLNNHTPMGIYRGGKYSAYEAGTRVPFIIRWPAGIKPCKQQSLFSQIDVYASLAKLLNQPLRPGAAPDSQEQLNTLLGKDERGREYVIQQNLNNTLALIKGSWKYIEPSDAPQIEYWTKMELGNEPRAQLYDLSVDPSETNNVAKEHPHVVEQFSVLLQQIKMKK